MSRAAHHPVLASEPLFRLDPLLLASAALLLLIGLVMVSSASVALAARDYANPLYFVQRQGVFAVIGLLAGMLALATPMVLWQRLGFLLVAVALLVLVLVLVPGVGHEVNGSARWLPVGPVAFQASEGARLLLMMYLAGYVVRHQAELESSFGGFLKPVMVIAVAVALLLAEPDFGAATVLLASTFGVLFLGGVRLRYFFVLLVVASLLMGIIAVTEPYRVERLMTFLNPEKDPRDAGYQLLQSLIAVGRGEWFGVGLGQGMQKLFYLPEAHTDFVFAILAEETGLAGVIATLSLYIVLVWRALGIARRAFDSGLPFQAYLAGGLGIWLALQTSINIAVIFGLLPTKGLTLPLMSYGGSSLLMTMVSLALLLRVHHETHSLKVQGRQRSKKISTPANRRVGNSGASAPRKAWARLFGRGKERA